jgi:hypothetical protein
MKKVLRRSVLLTAALVVVSAGALAALAAPPPLPETPAPAYDLVYARQFQLDSGFTFRWSAERPVVMEGWILVIEVDPSLVYPRQTAEPVLYVGDYTAQRINHGYPEGRVVAVVPGDVDLASAPIWFGSPELPERVSRATATAERASADAAGIRPLPAGVIEAAKNRGGLRLRGADVRDLDAALGSLLRRLASSNPDAGLEAKTAD